MTSDFKLNIKNLSISFPNHLIINNISFALFPKKITALVGQSGSGKSATALALLNLVPKAKISGEIIFQQKNLLNLSEKSLCKIRGKEIGMIFQDPSSSLNPLHKIGKQISDAITIHNSKISKKDLKKRVAELLKMVELESFTSRLNDYPHQLSGGQKQRLMIAIALVNNPKILIADEPTTALDMTIQSEILNLLLRLKNELNLAILFITHNLQIVKKIADEILVLHDGKIVERGTVTEIFSNPQNSYTKLLVNAIKPLNERVYKGSEEIILDVKNLSVIHKTKKSFLLALSSLTRKRRGSREFGFEPELMRSSNPSDSRMTMWGNSGNFFANKNINFSLQLGENLGIIGESGSGKSTLALALSHLIPSIGEINFFEQKNWQKNSFELRRDIQIIFQDPFSSLNPRMLVKDIVAEGLLIHKIEKSPEARQQRVDEILQKLKFDPNVKNRYPHQLSGGQRQRIAIARALILNPKILLLDEPTSALDLLTQNEILKLLFEIQKQQKISYIIISHDLNVVAQIADKIAVIKNGEILELDDKAKIISNPRQSYTKQLVSNFIS